MKPIGGLNRDVAPNDQQPGTYRHAKNILLTKLNQAVATEPGNSAEYAKSGWLLVGTIPVRNEAVVLFYVEDDYLTDSNALSSIVYLDKEGTAVTVVTHVDLNFSPEHPFKGVYYYNTKDNLVIAWTDNNNPPRILNVSDPGFAYGTPASKYIKRLNLFPEAKTPSVQGVVDTNTTGNIDNGAYTFFVAYEIDNEVSTNYLGGYGSFLVGNGSNFEAKSSAAIRLDIQNMDTNYDYIRFYVVKTAGSTKTAHYVRRLEIPSTGSKTITWTGATIEDVSYEDVIINNASYTKAKTLTVLNDRLHLGNVSTDNFIDYQPYANAITAKWTYRDSFHDISTGDLNIEAEEYGSFRGFMPGATYAFYIAFTLKDGTYSPAFHIPGRVPTASEISTYGNVFNSFIGRDPIRDCDINDYSTYDAPFTEQADPHSDTSYNYYQGNMSLHQNQTETYPDSDSWDTYNVQGAATGTSLRNQKVRHHKFPSLQKLAANVSNFNKKEILFGVKFDNILLPNELIDKVNGYSIFYAARDIGDMDVITYLPVLDNTFQDSSNWNISTVTNPGCGTPSLTVSCGQFNIINSSTQSTRTIEYENCAGVTTTLQLYPGQYITIDANVDGLPTGDEDDAFTVTNNGNTTPGAQQDVLISYTGPAGYTQTGMTNSCDSASLENGLRIYDPMLLSKKPAISNAYVMPEWYLNQPWKNTAGITLDEQDGWVSGIGSIKYAPANNAAIRNNEREECAILDAPNIVAGRWKGRAESIEDGIGGHISNYILYGSLRQYIPDMYTSYTNKLLASTNGVFDLTDLTVSSSTLISTIAPAGKKARTTALYGGDCSLERVVFQYMTAEDNNNTDMYDVNGSGTGAETIVNGLNHQGYTYFKDNAINKSVRRAIYVTPSRLPITKIYEDLGLKPSLTSFAVPSYGGDYLNQYLINPAYETINTTKPAFPFDSLEAELLNSFPTRIARSVVQQSESKDLQWRKFRSLDYYEHIRTKGQITNIEEYNNELLIHHEQSLFKTIGKDQLSADATEVFLGTGDIFSIPPREIIDIPLGYGGNQNLAASKLTKVGYFFLDLEQRKVFVVSDQLKEISSNGMRNWFRDNLDFALKEQLISKGIGNRYSLYDAPAHTHGCGFTSAYDEEYNRIVLAKKSWKFTTAGLAKVATDYNNIVEGKIYFFDGIPKVAAEGDDPLTFVYTPLNMSSSDVEYDSWTVSYSPATSSWVSFHDYKPSLLFNTRNRLFSYTGDTIFKHNVGANGTYYGTMYPTLLDMVFNPSPTQTKVFVNFNWVTESLNTSGGSVKKDTFTHATVYNSYQLSTKSTLTNLTTLGGNLRETESTWHFNAFRDKLSTQSSDIVNEDFTINYNLLDTAKPWYQQRRFIDKYVIIRLEYDNSTGNTLYLYEASSAARVSNR